MIVCGKEMTNKLNEAFDGLGFSHYHCGAHILNLAVQHGLEVHDASVTKARKFATKVKNSTLLADELRDICSAENLPFLAAQIDVSTRWNSTYLMLEKLKRMKPQTDILVSQQPHLNSDYLTAEDWAKLDVRNDCIYYLSY